MATKGKTASWYFNPQTCNLFVGWSGQAYPESYELEVCTEKPSINLGGIVVMRHIAPYAEFMNSLPYGITIYYKEIW